MRQRLGLAEVLMKHPSIAILDEPTATLDPHSTQEFLGMIRGLKADGTAVLLSSHHLDQVQSVCDRVALFNRGRIALSGSVTDLAHRVLGGGYVIDVEARGIGLSYGWRQFRVWCVPRCSVRTSTGSIASAICARRSRGNLGSSRSAAGIRFAEPSLNEVYTRTSTRCGMRRRGSPFTGVGIVLAKEAADYLSGARMWVLEALVF